MPHGWISIEQAKLVARIGNAKIGTVFVYSLIGGGETLAMETSYGHFPDSCYRNLLYSGKVKDKLRLASDIEIQTYCDMIDGIDEICVPSWIFDRLKK
jgi:hypothetical protein